MQLFANNATTTLSAGISATDLSLSVATGEGALFPSPMSPDYFLATLEVAGTTTREIVKVTARSSDTFTIIRAQEGTTALSWSAADTVSLRVTKGTLELLQSELALDGARGLKVVPSNLAQGTYNGVTYTPVTSGFYAVLSTTSIATGHAIGFMSKPSSIALNLLMSAIGSGGASRVRYWNGAWTTLTTTNRENFSTLGYSQLRAASPVDWTTGATGLTAGMYWLYYDDTATVTANYSGRWSHALSVDVTADEVIASNASLGKVITQSLGTISPDISIAGPIANGRGQSGAFSANTYIYLWLIYNPATGTWAGLWDVSATAPSLPSGSTYKVLIGGYRIDANSILLPWSQAGNRVAYPVAAVDLASGSSTGATAVTLTVPPIALATEVMVNPTETAGGTTVQAYISPEPFTAAFATARRIQFAGSANMDASAWLLLPLKIASTLYYAAGSNDTVSIGTYGYTMPGTLS